MDEIIIDPDDGIIPAHAGNTFRKRKVIELAGDHPRACGEHVLTCGVLCATWGSSPRMRGTLHIGELEDYTDGIIPAHAGNTIYTHNPWVPVRDHPRACGEHVRY